ncbi:MAG: monovalent cation/H+ antiporter complex subunit F [Rhodospirillales bacterium]
MFAFAALAVLVVMVLAVVRGFVGPTVYDRILAVNTFGTASVMLIAVLGFLNGRPEFLDIALLYALLNFIGTVAVTRFVRFSHLGGPLPEDDPGDI